MGSQKKYQWGHKQYKHLVTTQLNESWCLLCITKPCRVNLNLENGNGKVELGLGIRMAGLGVVGGRL